MAYPPASIAADKTDTTPALDDHPAHHNLLATAVNDIVAVLGADPAGDAVDVGARIAALELGVRAVSWIVSGLTAGASVAGAAANRALIQAGLDGVEALGGGTVFVPAGTWYIDRTLWLASKVRLRGAGLGVTKITRPATVKSLLTVNLGNGATTATVADGSLFAVGQGLHLADDSDFESWTTTNTYITGIAGNVLTFADASLHTLAVASNAAAWTLFPLIRNKLDAATTNVTLSNGTVTPLRVSTGIGATDITFDQNKGANDPPTLKQDYGTSTIHLEQSLGALFERVELLNAAGDAYSDQAYGAAAGAVGFLTGLNNLRTKNAFINGRINGSARHGVHLGTGMVGARIVGNEITDCGNMAVFYCAFVTHTIVANNIVDGCVNGFAGIDGRDVSNIIANNTILGCTGNAIEAAGASAVGVPAGRCVVIGNHILNGTGAGIDWNQPDSTIVGNVIDGNADTGFIALTLRAAADRCTVQGNQLRNGGVASYGLNILAGCDDVRVSGNAFVGLAQGASVNGVNRLVAVGNHMSTMSTNIGWNFESTVNTDCVVVDEMNTLTNPISGDASCVRLVYGGVGTNGASDPASAGDWNAATGKRHNGRLVRWNSGGGEKVSIYYQGVGWTGLN